MLRTIIAGLKARTARLVLSSVAIALGVAFVTGTLVLGDAMNLSLREEFAKSARNVDVAVSLPDDSTLTGVPQGTVDAVRQAPGVEAADPRFFVQVPLIGGDGKARPAVAVPLATSDKLREYDLKEGRYPEGPNEIAVDTRTATAGKLSLGKPVSLLAEDDRRVELTVVGVYTQGAGSAQMSGIDHVVLEPAALTAFDPDALPYQVVAVAKAGVTQQQLADAVRTAVGADFQVLTGEQLTKKLLAQISSEAGEFTTLLLAFALIALVVASMVIYNTFTILVAQRTRELALMRCVGASRGQVFRGVLAEAVVMGLAASVIGLFGGLGVSALLQKVISGFADSDGDVLLPMSPTTVLAAFGVGVIVTVLAAVLPARKATRVAPIAALREQIDSGEEVSRTGLLRVLSAVVLAIVGAGVVVVGAGIKGESALFVTGGGTMVMLLAAVVIGPLVVGPVNRALGVLPRLVFGVPAKLASANAGRNPKRTSATTAALMIGVTIVAMITVVANSAKETANTQIDARFPADYTVTSSVGDRPLPQDLATKLEQVSEVEHVAPMTEVYGEDGYFTGVPRSALGDLVKPAVSGGSLDALGDGKIALNVEYAQQHNLAVGSTVEIKPRDGVATTLSVVALIKGQRLSDGMVTLETAARIMPDVDGYQSILVKLKPGVADGRAAVERVTSTSPLAVLDSAAETKAQLNTQLDQVLAFVWALIGLAVVIALFGIANTLTLSVLERTRESALLRALGLTRGQLRLMLVVESILMALMGAAVGLALGIGFGWLLTSALSSDTLKIDLIVPFGQIGVMLAAAVLAAVLAAALPARRAARTSIVGGMATT
ncbi:ABC transporter permease [Saccharothrix violaceirubra]|uniref:Putative ABC transport system permease protein n=1 Tax=Saccharothrix violaceirubra TaxID=413306 RepID=A0A7W7WUU3_9PSEU|nr:ABC transporter permease [Saccharothrix violaceirubra]MBB4964202.1 putative ABC transport system permease protein [Saccharothrix violaceirubra]